MWDLCIDTNEETTMRLCFVIRQRLTRQASSDHVVNIGEWRLLGFAEFESVSSELTLLQELNMKC